MVKRDYHEVGRDGETASLAKLALKRSIRALITSGFHFPLLTYCVYRITKVSNAVKSDLRPSLLALSPQRFVNDLAVISETKEFRILVLPRDLQMRMLALFYGVGKPGFALRDNDYQGDALDAENQKQFDRFMALFLDKLYEKLNIKGVLSPAIYYWEDVEFGRVSQRISRPYIVLHKENLITTQSQRESVINLLSKLPPFSGSRIILHNEAMRQSCIDSGIASSDKVKALGCLRMDKYLKRVGGAVKNTTGKKRVTLFSFVHSVGMFKGRYMFDIDGLENGFFDLFEAIHVSIAKMALENPEVEFVIKPKWGLRWLDVINDCIERSGIGHQNVSNLVIDADIDAQQLIIDSDVIVGFGSTVLLEAAIAQKLVIVPSFCEAADREKFKFILLHEEQENLFQVARSIEEFETLILDGLTGYDIGPECLKSRWQAFETWVSDERGDSSGRYIKEFWSAIKEIGDKRSVTGDNKL